MKASEFFKKVSMGMDPVEKNSPFQKLRASMHEEIDKAVDERKRTNPQATDLEYNLGIFVEELEPQVRDAVIELNRKGYRTEGSGFSSANEEHQYISGWFNLDDETKAKLKAMSVDFVVSKTISGKASKNEQGEYSSDIRFKPTEPDLSAIKNKWDEIAALLPDKGSTIPPPFLYTEANSGDIFRELHPRKPL